LITIQNVKGLNAVLLLEALKAAIAKTRYRLNTEEEPIVSGNSIFLTMGPDQRGEYFFTHRLIARIQSDAGQVSLEVSSNAYTERRGRRTYAAVEETLPQEVLGGIEEALTGKSPGG